MNDPQTTNNTSSLPLGWVSVKLGEICPLKYGKSLPEKERNLKGHVPVYGSSGQVGTHDEALTARAAIVVGRKGNVGSVHYSPVPCWPIDTTYFVEDAENLCLPFMAYLLRFLRLDKLDKSTAIPSLNRNDYNSIFAPIPPLAEQQRIVEKLDELISQIDAELASFAASRIKTKNYRASLLSEAVSGQLSAAWRAERKQQGIQDESASVLLQRILEERRRLWEQEQSAKRTEKAGGQTQLVEDESWKSKYVEPAAPDVANLPKLPDSWCWASLEQLSTFVTSGSRGWAKFYSKEGAAFLRVGNLMRDVVGLDLSNLQRVKLHGAAEGARTRVQKGDILISITADIGRVGIVPPNIEEAYINQHISLVRCVPLFSLH